MDGGRQARRVIDELSSSVWAFATLTAALEAGLLEQLADPQELGAISAHSGLDPSLVEGILDVVVALGLVRRDGQLFAAAPGLTPLLVSDAKEVLVAQLRSTDLQARQLVDAARHGSLVPGWQHTDPMLLEAQGRSGKGAMPAMIQALRQNPELAARLSQPSASFLDVGVGVGVIAIELCRAFPALRVVGLEPAAAPLAQARANVAAAKRGLHRGPGLPTPGWHLPGHPCPATRLSEAARQGSLSPYPGGVVATLHWPGTSSTWMASSTARRGTSRPWR